MDKNNRTKTFMELLVGLEAIEFVGLCKFLGVRLIEEKDESAPTKLILFEVMSNTIITNGKYSIWVENRVGFCEIFF